MLRIYPKLLKIQECQNGKKKTEEWGRIWDPYKEEK